MEKDLEHAEACQNEGACAGPRCPFARLLGTKRGRGALVLLMTLGLVHYFSEGPVSAAAFVLMWILAIGLSAWVLIPGRPRRPAKVSPT